MNEGDAVQVAKRYVNELLSDEGVTNLSLEAIEPDHSTNGWLITLAFSRPWNSPRMPAMQALETIGVLSNQRRSFKVLSVTSDGQVLSMKSRPKADVD